jgi:hypothetical protein
MEDDLIQEPKKYDPDDPVNKSIGRHKRKIMKKYQDHLNSELGKRTFSNGLDFSRYVDKLVQDLLDKESGRTL